MATFVFILLFVTIASTFVEAKSNDQLIIDDIAFCSATYYAAASKIKEENDQRLEDIQLADNLKDLGIRLSGGNVSRIDNMISDSITSFNAFESVNLPVVLTQAYLKCDFFTRQLGQISLQLTTFEKHYKKYGAIPQSF